MNQHQAHVHPTAGAGPGPIAAGGQRTTWLLLAALVATGVGYAFARQVLHIPLQLPGHNGLHWMALLVAARVLADRPWAATAVAAGTAAASNLPVLGIHEAFAGWHYLLTGAVLDLLLIGMAAARRHVVIIPLLAALAFMSKPVSKFVLAGTLGVQYGSLRHGLAWPLTTHLAFGFAGAMVGLCAALLAQRALRRG